VGPSRQDFLFEPRCLIVETDSRRYHKTRRAFEEDRARDVLTTRAGYRTLRFTDRQLTDDPHAVAAAIGATLRA
jgi:very-short-patch-repair endonuclease